MQAGNFQPFWDNNKDKLKAFIRASVRQKSETEDILQEIYLQAAAHFATLQENDKFTSWIFTITRNYLYRHFQQEKKFLYVEEDVFEMIGEQSDFLQEQKTLRDLADQCMEKIGNPSALLQADIASIYEKILDQFPDYEKIPLIYLEAFVECDVKQISQQAFADKKGISLSAAKSRVQRAREKIKQLFMECCFFEFDARGSVVNYTPICKDKNCALQKAS